MRAYRLQKVQLYSQPTHWSALQDVVRAVLLVDHRGIEEPTNGEYVVSNGVDLNISGNHWYSGVWRYGGAEKYHFWENSAHGGFGFAQDSGTSRISALAAWRPMEDFIEMIESGRLEINKSGQRVKISSIAHFQNYINAKQPYAVTSKCFHA